MADTLADRIMAAAERFAWSMGQWGGAEPGIAARAAARDAEAFKEVLAALVAEACAPQPERVCRWTTMRGPDGGKWRRAECPGNSTRRPAMTGTFCPDCGGRVEVVAEGQEADYMEGATEFKAALDEWREGRQ